MLSGSRSLTLRLGLLVCSLHPVLAAQMQRAESQQPEAVVAAVGAAASTLSAVVTAAAATPAAKPEATPAAGATNPSPVVALLDQSATQQQTGEQMVYGQLRSLKEEFAEIRKDDDTHISRIQGHVELRDQLRKKLALVQQTLKEDNQLLTSEAGKVQQQGNQTQIPKPLVSLLSLGSQVQTKIERDVHAEVAGFLAKHALDSGAADLAGTLSEEEQHLASSAIASLDLLDQQLDGVRKRDEEEVAALHANAVDRQNLEAVIAKQQAQLTEDVTELGGSLENIVKLVNPPTEAPPAEAAAVADPAVTPAAVATETAAAPAEQTPLQASPDALADPDSFSADTGYAAA